MNMYSVIGWVGVCIGWLLWVQSVTWGITLTFDSSPIKETFAKLSGTTIMCLDSQSSKLGFPIDSRLRGNDGRFCKGLLVTLPLWIADQVRNDMAWWDCLAVTL